MFGIDDFIMGSVAGGLIDAFAGHSANQANIEQANANREFSRNAHQIEVADLYAAGLNPMLSYRGSGAGLGGGVLADVKPLAERTGEKITSAMAASKQGRVLDTQATKNDSEANLADATAAKARAETTAIERSMAKIPAEIGGLTAGAQASAATAAEKMQAIEESKRRMEKMGAEIKNIGASINLANAETELKVALTTGTKIDSQIKDANYNAILSMAKSEALIKEYEATEKALGAKAAQASWRVWLAEKGLTITQVENIMSALPNVALIYPMKTFNNTFINPVKK